MSAPLRDNALRLDRGRSRVVFRGGGEMASAAAHLLFRRGFRVAVLERASPLAVRRLVCFAEAVRQAEVRVEGVPGRLVSPEDLVPAFNDDDADRRFVPVVVDPEGACIERLAAPVLVDGRMAKLNLGTRRSDAPLVIGLGPGFTAGEDVHAVVETQRGGEMGRVLWSGRASADSLVPGPILGVTEARVLRAPRSGAFTGEVMIGDLVSEGRRVGAVAGEPILTRISGIVRGLLADGVEIEAGVKVGDVDPRGRDVDPARISDKGHAVAAGVLEAVLAAAVVFEGRG